MDDILYSLPDDLRDKLKEPIGLLVNERDLLKLLLKEEHIVSVGDQVTYTILKNDIEPIFCVVDFKTKREHCSDDVKKKIQSFGKKRVIIKNPPRCISGNLWKGIESAFNNLEKNSLLIEIDGEEDLAALPAILLAPGNVTIIYGLPNKGVVVVKASKENKRKVKEILDKM